MSLENYINNKKTFGLSIAEIEAYNQGYMDGFKLGNKLQEDKINNSFMLPFPFKVIEDKSMEGGLIKIISKL